MTEKRFWEWLLEIGVVDQDGKFDVSQAKKELWDYYNLIDRVERVYDVVTGGMVSQARVTAEAVIQQHDEYMEREIEAALKEAGVDVEEAKG